MESDKNDGNKKSVYIFLLYFTFKFSYHLFSWSNYISMKASKKWNLHRLSSFSLIILTSAFMIFFFNSFQLNQIEVQNNLSTPLAKSLLLGFFFNALFHARLELWSIYDDYFKGRSKKLFQIITYVVLIILAVLVLPIIGVKA
jgi:succinate dehydrogenase hydrophobic membrane anchor protein|tara:strand:+ start:119 stop:547 length:429 start_codon:yes stop_codon:yes gene_type:complete